MGALPEIGIVLLLFVANGVFAASELALVSARRNRLEAMAERGDERARKALELAAEPGRFLATVQVGITLVGTIAAAFGGSNLVPYLEPSLRPALGNAAGTVAFLIVVAGITFASLIVGELVPKRLALRSPEGLAVAIAPLMTVLSRVSSGLVWVLTATSNLVLRLFGAHTPTQEQVTEEDVRAAVAEAAESGGLEAAESRLIERVLGLTDRTARELMTPRRDIVSLNVLSPENELVQAAIDGGHARYAAHEGSLDETVGFLHTRDLLRLGREPDLAARDLIRQALYVPENADSEDVLRSFQRHGSRAAFVVDEYGSIIGLITITDVLSELVHDLADGDDATPAVTLRDDGSYLVEGDAPPHEVRERIGLPKGNEDAATMAGYVLHHLGHIPAVAETITVEGWRLEVMDMDGSRIDAVLVVPPG